MRLTEKGKVGEGHPHSALFDKFVEEHGPQKSSSGGARGASRNKEASSLEFHPPAGLPPTSLAHPPTMKAMKQPSQDHILAEQQEQQQKQAAQRQVKTRARGASGLPPRKYTLEELPHLDQESFLKALYDDPELARAFAEEHQKDQSKTGSSSSTGTGGPKMKRSMKRPETKYRRTKDGTVDKEPQFLEELKKGGVPVAQWAVLITIAAAVFFQLYKILSGPQATSSGKKLIRVPVKKAKQGNSKSKRQSSGTVADTDPVEEKVLAEVEKVVADPAINDKKKKAPPKRATKKPAAKQRASTSAASAKAQKQETETVPKENGAKPSARAAPVQEIVEPTFDEGEWKTVGKRSEPVTKVAVEAEPPKGKTDNGVATKNKKQAEEKTETPALKAAEPAAPPAKEPEPQKEPVVEETPAPPPMKVKAEDESSKENTPKETNAGGATTSSSKKKKSKKKGKKEDQESAPQNGETRETATPLNPTATKNDAQLALELQAEEEVWAAAEAAALEPPQEDIWEEVTTRRRKPTSTNTKAPEQEAMT